MMSPVYTQQYGGQPQYGQPQHAQPQHAQPMSMGGGVLEPARQWIVGLTQQMHQHGANQQQVVGMLNQVANHMKQMGAMRSHAGAADFVTRFLAEEVVRSEVKRALSFNDVDGMPPAGAAGATAVFNSGATVPLQPLVLQAGSALFKIMSSEKDLSTFVLRSLSIGTWQAQLSSTMPLDALDKRLDTILAPIVGRIFTTAVTISGSYVCTVDNSKANGLAIQLYNPGKTCNLDPMSRPDERLVGASPVTSDGNHIIRLLRGAVSQVINRQPVGMQMQPMQPVGWEQAPQPSR